MRSAAQPEMFRNADGDVWQIDGNAGGTAAISEMLVQSHVRVGGGGGDGGGELGEWPDFEVHLLPALPAAWSDGEVSGLRARGGVTIVRMRWAGGALEEVVLRVAWEGKVWVRCCGDGGGGWKVLRGGNGVEWDGERGVSGVSLVGGEEAAFVIGGG